MKTYTLTPQQFEKAKQFVQQATGEVLPAGKDGYHGEITQDGVTLDYTFDGLSKLDIAVKHKPSSSRRATSTMNLIRGSAAMP